MLRNHKRAVPALIAALTLLLPNSGSAPASRLGLSVRVVGNRFVDGRGRVLRLLGVNRPGMDALLGGGFCLTTQDFADVSAMVAWHVNAVRIPLNEDCWLGINGPDRKTAVAYRAGVVRYVAMLHQRGLYAILDLHRTAPGTVPATAMQPLPDMDHSVSFWSSVASTFVNDAAVVFDLYNEPHLTDVMPAGADYWRCWRSGCTLSTAFVFVADHRHALAMTWRAAGMQDLIDAVRQTGAKQPVMLEGLGYANRLSANLSGPISWLMYKPYDPAGQLVASTHDYKDTVGCVTAACWTQQYAPVARLYPMVTGELGQNDCAHDFVDEYMRFADALGISYLAWEWSPETVCVPGRNYGLITNWHGAATSLGADFRTHLAAAAGPSVP